MKKVKVGNSLEINKIAFGAWAIGGDAWGGNAESDSYNAVRTAIENGLTTIDTAPIYGFGRSEEVIGKVVKKMGLRDQVQILTKFGINWRTSSGKYYFKTVRDGKELDVHLYSGKDGIIRECEESLKRLKTDFIDLYQVHRPDPTTPIEETMLAMEELKKQGKILEGGVSNYELEQLQKAAVSFPLATNQMPYSMLERGIEKDMLPWCMSQGIGILAYSPLQRGILSGKYRGKINWNEDDHRRDTLWFSDENRERINSFLDKISLIAEKYDASLAQLVINWTASVEGVSSVLVGARNAGQVLQNIKSLEFELEDSEISQIRTLLNKLQLKRG